MSSRHAAIVALVDDRIPRAIAGATVVVATTVLVTGWWLLLVPLAADFVARATGRTHWSPLARAARAYAQRRPRRRVRTVAARPKQFAAGIGAAVTGLSAVAVFGFSAAGVASGLLAVLVVAAALEAAFGFCVGCRLYGLLARSGAIADACPECSDLPAAAPKPSTGVVGGRARR